VDRVGLLVPVATGKGPPAEPTADGWRLQSEREYLVEGDAAALTAVLDALPTRVARRWGPVVRLTFGNSVGRVPAGPLGTLHLQSGKWDEADYDHMLAGVAEEALSLPFATSAATALPYARDSELADEPPYHALVWLAHALLDTPLRPLLGALNGLVTDPHRRLVRSEREVPVELARSLGPRTIDDILSLRWPLQRVQSGQGVGGFMPLRIAETSVQHSLDTAENRFVKAFLDSCAHLVARVRTRSAALTPDARRRVARKLDAVAQALAPIRRASMWRAVGRLTHLATGSSVMQRDARYREVLRASVLLRGASRALPLSDDQVTQLLEVKDVALLYELWCGFILLGLLRELLGPPLEVTPVRDGAAGSNVPWGLRARWQTGVELAFNPSYTQTNGWHGRSRSVDLRPDLVVRIPVGPHAGLHVFDAKFKHDGVDGAVVEADIHKMHAYRDAIKGVRSAWVLFPGAKPVRFPDSEGSPSGVGAFVLLPGHVDDALRDHLAAVVN